MEFEEMQKIWDEQKGENMYVINESALHKSVTRKKNAASRRISIVEIFLMLINGSVSIVLLSDAIIDKEGFWDYGGAVVMALTVVFLFYYRMRRIKNAKTFDRSMLGELDHAIANSESIIQIATLMIYYYLLPVAFFSIGQLIYNEASIESWLSMIGLYSLAFFLVRWERRKLHIPRKKSLLALKKKLMEE